MGLLVCAVACIFVAGWLAAWFPQTSPWVWYLASLLIAVYLLSLPSMIARASIKATPITLLQCDTGEKVQASPDVLLPQLEFEVAVESFTLYLSLSQRFSWDELGEQRALGGDLPDSHEAPRMVLAFVFFANEGSPSGRVVPVRIECRHATRARVVQMLEAMQKLHAKRMEMPLR